MLMYGYYEVGEFSIVSPTRGAIAHGVVRGKEYETSLSPLELPSSAAGGNAKSNSTTNNNTRLDILPPAPFTYRLPNPPHLSLELSQYGPPFEEEEDILDVYDSALTVINASIHDHTPLFPPDARGSALWFTNDNGTANLLIQVSRQITWKDLADVVRGLERCMLTYGYFEIGRFKIIHPEKGEIGIGSVKGNETESSSRSPLGLPGPSQNSTTNNSRLVIPATPYIFRIPSSHFSLALNFTAFGASLPDTDATQVYIFAAVYIESVLSRRKYSVPIPRGTVLHWSHGQVELTLEHEDGMTWGEAAEVLNGLVGFQMREGYTGARFEVLREGRAPRGRIGGGTVELRRSKSQGDDREMVTSRILPWDGGNTTASSEHLELLTMPPDPITLRIPDSTLSLRFSHYGRGLPQVDFLTVMLKMTLRAIKEMQKPEGDHPIGDDQQWRWDRALVELYSESEMMWGMLGSVVNGITSFAMRYGWLTFSFDIVDDKLGGVGAGFVEYV